MSLALVLASCATTQDAELVTSDEQLEPNSQVVADPDTDDLDSIGIDTIDPEADLDLVVPEAAIPPAPAP